MPIETFRALKNYNYRIYFFGQGISLIGTWMERTAIYWLVFDITKSSSTLGWMVFATQFPSFLFSLFGGVISDRYSKFKLSLLTQFAFLIQAVLLTCMVYFAKLEIWQFFVLGIVQGIIYAFDLPARQSLLNEIMDNKEDIPNAVALNSSLARLGWLLAPALAGIVLQSYGAFLCFLLNALSYLIVFAFMFLMKVKHSISDKKDTDTISQIREGFAYIKNNKVVLETILLLAFTSLLVLPFNTLLPVFTEQVYKGNASTYGYLNSFMGAGALLGSIWLATIRNNIVMSKLLSGSLFFLGVSLILFSQVAQLTLGFCLATSIGLTMMFQTTLTMSIVQMETSQEMMGRVMGILAMVFFGIQPIGGLLIGMLSERMGAGTVVLIQGFSGIIIMLLFLIYKVKQK
jgi:MFS family permease